MKSEPDLSKGSAFGCLSPRIRQKLAGRGAGPDAGDAHGGLPVLKGTGQR
jgi:hypothetical protein